jgi:hypothetical protein
MTTPRIAGDEWMKQRSRHATAVFNSNYTTDMKRINWRETPWSVHSPAGFRDFPTHAEALAWAFENVGAKA